MYEVIHLQDIISKIYKRELNHHVTKLDYRFPVTERNEEEMKEKTDCSVKIIRRTRKQEMIIEESLEKNIG